MDKGKNIEKTSRYPGIVPFNTDQSHLFFGRNTDVESLFQQIRRQQTVVLYGKSGLGKSSLINAGIIPKCTTNNLHSPLVFRFNAWTDRSVFTLLEITKNLIVQHFHEATFLDHLLPNDHSLWYYIKTWQLVSKKYPLLIFDQFEELFSYPEEQIIEFQKELAEVLFSNIPLRFIRMADKSSLLLTEDEEALENEIKTRVVFAIRSDRMHLLDRFKGNFPSILRNTYELKALKRTDAYSAIVEPAKIKGQYTTHVYQYTPAAIEKLLNFLEDKKDAEGRIEGILLQMLCEYYDTFQVKAKGVKVLDLPAIGNPELVVKKYYADKISDLSKSEQLPARRLIEEGLVSDGGMRITLHESFISQEYNITRKLLGELVNRRLLRTEPFIRGGYNFELSHDRLVPPVLQARHERKVEESAKQVEEKQKEQQQKLEALTKQALLESKLREKAEKGEAQARQRTRLAVGISIFALLLACLSGVFFLRSQVSEQKALNAKIEAEKQTEIALDQKDAAAKALSDFQKEKASKDSLRFQILEGRASVILDLGGCPLELLNEMKVIASSYPNSIELNAKIESLNAKNPNCQ